MGRLMIYRVDGQFVLRQNNSGAFEIGTDGTPLKIIDGFAVVEIDESGELQGVLDLYVDGSPYRGEFLEELKEALRTDDLFNDLCFEEGTKEGLPGEYEIETD